MATEYREPVSDAGGDAGGATIDPSAIDPGAVAPEPPRKRKQRSDAGTVRAGTGGASKGSSKKAEKVSLDLSSLEGMFVGLHVLLAERTMTPELAITPDEGKQFMGAVQNVMRHYSVQTTQKTLDWISLFGVASGMYAPRIVAINVRKKMRAAQGEAPKTRRPTGPVQQPGAGAPTPMMQIVPGTGMDIEEGANG